MYKYFIEKIISLWVFSFIGLFAEVDIQQNMYEAAEEMMRFDEKMTRLIREHNQIDDIDDSPINDFEETDDSYVLQEKMDTNDTEVSVLLTDGLLTINMLTRSKEHTLIDLEETYNTVINKSTTSLYVPQDADLNSMNKSYENGILEIRFLKK